MARKVEKTKCSNTMTEAAFNEWVKNQLRLISTKKWRPILEVKARRYCEICNVPFRGNAMTRVITSTGKIKSVVNKCVDHIEPVTPETGFDGYDSFVRRLFCEKDNLRLLCWKCHNKVTKESAQRRKLHRQKMKEINND